MPTSDGVYITLDELKDYGLKGDHSLTPDDAFLVQSIKWAEQRWNEICGIAFNQQTLLLAPSFTPFIDSFGWLHLFAREATPVTAVSQVQIFDRQMPSSGWQTISFDPANILFPQTTDPPPPDSSHIMLFPTSAKNPSATGTLLARWSYTGGYSTIPAGLKAIITRLAWWHYKIREAPLGRIVTGAGGLGMMEVPLALPADVLADSMLWRPNMS